MRKSRKLRLLIESPAVTTVMGASSGLAAILAEEAGFDAVWSSSFEVSAFRGLPDASLLTMTDYLRSAVEVDRACGLPVVADCDTGFGNSLNIAHMIHEYEAAGIAAVCIEDKIFPKVNSFSSRGQVLEDVAEFAHRIAVAKAAQRDPDLVVIARTEALIAGCDVNEALRRATAYAEAGADAILVHSKSSVPDEVQEFLGKWSGIRPVVVVPTTYYDWPVGEMQKAGVAMSIYANQGLRATVSAVRRTLSTIREDGSSAAVENEVASVREIFELQRLDEWLSLSR
ncbi:isocitrate lyase/phosphoenolpyruvate mutase family protein [Kitasatospora sp. NPDC094019]|uniref:isocitrate lyase/phosphoenolpyruvate mutase family protein n=1 Tax=Kitasatospora sp. NPDC094019 TaxID=3364091 RepID=UPI003823270E